jgi:hypothetical protein
MVTRIENIEFTEMVKTVKPDAKKRITLPSILVQDGIIFRVCHNSIGQILLDPQVTIPASELWLFKDKRALASIDKGMSESVNGQIIDRGSFAKYARDES